MIVMSARLALCLVLVPVTSQSCVSSPAQTETRLLITGLNCSLHKGREARQAFYGDTDVPVLNVDPHSLEGAKIAQQISTLFREGGASSPPKLAGYAAINRVNLTVRGQTDPVRSPPAQSGPSYTTPFQLNVNLNLELEHGRPNKVRVPQGELMLMYIPEIRGPAGGASVEVSHQHLRQLLSETEKPSSLVMLPSGGLLLMSLTPYPDTDHRYVVKAGDDDQTRQAALAKNKIHHRDKETFSLESYSRKKGNIQDQSSTEKMETSTEFKYPAAWKDKLPKFPFVPREDEVTLAPVKETVTKASVKDTVTLASAWENGEMPVFPFSSAGKKKTPPKPPHRLNFTWPYTPTESSPTATTTPSTMTTTRRTSLIYSMLTESPPIFTNEIEVHRPVFKKPSSLASSLREETPKQSLNLTDLYQRLKINFEKSVQDLTLQKRYRKDDQTRLGFDNVNVVVPGRFNPQSIPNGVTQCKKDSSTNGTRVCSRPVQNNCQGGFKIGGNCNGQQRLDNTKLPPSEFQMSDQQISNSDTRFVPFSPQQTNMNMLGSSNTRLVPPSQFQFQFDRNENRDTEFVRIRTTTRPPRTQPPRQATSTATTTMSSNDELVHRVMNMDPPELADALMDPMMMAMGTMLAMSGAYMAMVLQETAAANALSLALAGKKKKKK